MDFKAVKKAVVAGFAWQGATKIVVQTASWASTIFVARLISPDEYGIVAAAAVVTQLLVVLTELGMAQGLIRRQETTREQEDGVFYLGLLLGLLAFALLYLAAPAIAGFYRMPILEDALRVLGLMVVFGSLKTVPLAIVMRRMDFRYRSLVEMGANLMMTVTVIVMAVNGFGIWSLIWGPVVAQFCMMVAYLPLLRRIPRPTLFGVGVGEVALFGIKVSTTTLLYFIWSRADIMVIGRVLGERAVGMYSMAFQLAMLPLDKIGSIFNHVMFPALSRLQDDLRASQELFLDLHRYLLMITYPILFGLIVVASDFIELLLTETWLPIVPYLQGLCLVSALRVSSMVMPPALYARGEPGVMVRYSTLCLLLLPPTFYVGAQYGLQGVIAGWGMVFPLLYLILARYCLRNLRLGWLQLLRSMAPAAAASAVMVAGVVGFQNALAAEWALLPRLSASVALGAALYLGVLLLLYREQVLGFREKMLLLRGRNAQT